MNLRGLLASSLLLLVLSPASPAAAGPTVRHPNLLLNRAEIEQVKVKISRHEWAARLFDQVKEIAAPQNDSLRSQAGGYNLREIALCYALTGERAYADRARRRLLDMARVDVPRYQNLNLETEPGLGSWMPWDVFAWVYDLTYDTYSDAERQQVEDWLRTCCKVIMKAASLPANDTTPNLIFIKHFDLALVGFCLGDRELIDWGMKDPGAFGPQKGGFYPVMDSMIHDGFFWGESPTYGLLGGHAMLALAEAARHYDGTDLYHYVAPKSGASIKSVLDGFLRLAYPLERTGIGGGALRLATYGDGSTSYSGGAMTDVFLHMGSFLGCLELAYQRYREPGYAWVLSLNPQRDADLSGERASMWSYIALTHGAPLPDKLTPPPAPSGVYVQQGAAMLRSDESPAFWTSGGIAALVRLGAAVGHGHPDYYGLTLHGKGRLLYPDLQLIQYEPTYLGWGREGIGHSTLVVDHASPRPGPCRTRQDLNADVTFVALTGSAYEGVEQTRCLLMTKDYLADIFHAADQHGVEHTFDWVLHGLGRLYPGHPGAYHDSDDLLAHYWWIDRERSRSVDATWQVDWIQRSAGITPGLQFGKEWFDHEVGVRMTMLGRENTRVYHGDGPITDGPPYHRFDGNPEGAVPLALVRRQGQTTTFAAVHEPYEGTPRIRHLRRLAETPEALAMAVAGPDGNDYVLVAFDDEEHTLVTAGGEAFTFSDYGYIRVREGGTTVRGKLRAFRIRVAGRPEATVGGQHVPLRRDADFVVLGDLPVGARAADAVPAREDPAEQTASLHYWFTPEEVHLSALKAGAERDVEVHLRCVGAGRVHGALRIVVPPGVSVEPAQVDIAPLAEGKESVAHVKVRAAAGAASKIYPIQFLPGEGISAARQTLTASVGIVMTVDRRIPGMMQHLVRAPGYTLRLDDRSGVCCYLLDADGHRRHGRTHDANPSPGFPGLEGMSYNAEPCDFIWPGHDSVTIVGKHMRYQYTFQEDRIVFAMVSHAAAFDPTKAYTVSLGNFDTLLPPVGMTATDRKSATYTGERFFFPHPAFRQGLLLLTPPGTTVACRRGGKGFADSPIVALTFPLEVGQEVTMMFAAE